MAYFGKDDRAGAPIPISYNRFSDSFFRNPLYDLAAARAANDALNEAIEN